MDLKLFAERLRELRLEKGLTTIQLADAVGFGDSAISYWENQKRMPSAESISKLAQFFGVSTDYLIGLKDH